MKSQAQTPGVVEVEAGCQKVSIERTPWFQISKVDVIDLAYFCLLKYLIVIVAKCFSFKILLIFDPVHCQGHL